MGINTVYNDRSRIGLDSAAIHKTKTINKQQTPKRHPFLRTVMYVTIRHLISPAPPLSIIQRRPATLRRTLDNTSTVSESRAKEDIRVREQDLLERHDDELRTAEARADVLRVR